MLSIQALLSSPEPDDPLDTTVADHFKNNRKDADNVRAAPGKGQGLLLTAGYPKGLDLECRTKRSE